MEISVIIATYNRASYLSIALESLCNQTLNANRYEILVIDNASIDNTLEIVNDYSSKNPAIRYIFEPTPGANIARNVGWQKAQGKYVAFMDDDAIAFPQWLEVIVSCFVEIVPQPAIVGGRVIPIWEGNKPDWIQGKLLTALSVVDYGEVSRYLTNTEYFFSVNMTFQRTLLEKFGGFDVSLGRSGKKLTSNDEILIAKRIRNAGHLFYYHPMAAVQHHVPSNRLKVSWFKKRYYLQGYSEAQMWKLTEHPVASDKIAYFFLYFYRFFRNPKRIFLLFYNPLDYSNLYKKLIAHSWIGFLKGIF